MGNWDVQCHDVTTSTSHLTGGDAEDGAEGKVVAEAGGASRSHHLLQCSRVQIATG